jgi:hypothetical protein
VLKEGGGMGAGGKVQQDCQSNESPCPQLKFNLTCIYIHTMSENWFLIIPFSSIIKENSYKFSLINKVTPMTQKVKIIIKSHNFSSKLFTNPSFEIIFQSNK